MVLVVALAAVALVVARPVWGAWLYGVTGAAFEAGAMWTRALGEDLDETRLGGQLFLGGNTPFGPVTASFGVGESGDYAAFIGIGRPVRGRWR